MEQLRLDTAAFEGDSNAYLAGTQSDAPTTLIDTGIATDEIRSQLRDALADRDVAFSDIERVLLTHFHYDHVGLAGEIQRQSGARVYAHPADAPLVGGSTGAINALIDGHRDRLDEWGMPPAAQTELLDFLEVNATLAGEPVTVTELHPGDRFDIGDGQLKVIHLPGHTRGHVGYALGTDQLVCGDALLPVYTPNIGGADVRVERPLITYLDTLRRIVERDLDLAWPGHRDPIHDPTARAHTIRDHHRDRTARIIETLDDRGPMDAWSVASTLFGDLAGIHILHGPGEAAAHLDHLVDEEVAVRQVGRYRLVSRAPDPDALVPPLTVH